MNTYEVIKECWINKTRYQKTQLIKLTDAQAYEWLYRKCIKLKEDKKNYKPKPIIEE